jgi:hypothetical protein
MKKLLLSLLFIGSFSSNAQVTVFEDSFESYTNFAISGFGNWQTIDVDLLPTYVGGLPPGVQSSWPNSGAPMAFQIFNPSSTTPQPVENSTDACNINVNPPVTNENFDPRTGSKYAACWGAVPSTTGGATANNDWLVSPVINLGASNNELKFWVKSLSNCYGLERYRVGVYVGTGTPTPADFVNISGITALSAPYGAWEERTFALNAYSNQSIRIGIRCISADVYMFMVDDFRVTSSNLKVDEFFSNKFSAYPNPATNSITVANNESIILNSISITDINGRNVKEVKVNNVSETEVNISDLSSGIYFMNINTDNGKAVKKIIKN